MRERDERDERFEDRSERQPKKEWAAPRVEELPPLTELALGSLTGSGSWGGWDFS